MALVTSLEPNTKDRQSVHKPTRCLYAVVEGTSGERYLQLDTVGSEGREIPDKVSQSIQFDRQAAGQLLQLIHQTFPDLGKDNGGSAREPPADAEEDEGIEGRTLLRLHRLKERDRRLVRRKKREVLARAGCLRCEVCEFDFEIAYGMRGHGFAECHHRVPLKDLDGKTPTRLADLAMVCANCHRMLHHQPIPTVEQLRAIVEQRRGKS